MAPEDITLNEAKILCYEYESLSEHAGRQTLFKVDNIHYVYYVILNFSLIDC